MIFFSPSYAAPSLLISKYIMEVTGISYNVSSPAMCCQPQAQPFHNAIRQRISNHLKLMHLGVSVLNLYVVTVTAFMNQSDIPIAHSQDNCNTHNKLFDRFSDFFYSDVLHFLLQANHFIEFNLLQRSELRPCPDTSLEYSIREGRYISAIHP